MSVNISLALVQLIIIPLFWFDLIRLRSALTAALIILLYEVLQTVRTATLSERRALFIFLCWSFIVGAIASSGVEPSLYKTSYTLLLLAIGWSLPLTLVAMKPPFILRFTPLLLKMPVIFSIAIAALLWVAFRAIGHPVIIDEVGYLLQAQYVRNAPFMRPLQTEFARVFVLRQTYLFDGYLNGQYPPGWPFVLSLGSTTGSLWILLLTLHLLFLLATNVFGRTVESHRVGALATALLSVHGFALYWSTMIFPHIFVAALALISGALMVRSFRLSVQWRSLSWVFAGFLLGLACATRPLTGITLTSTLWRFVLVRQRPNPRVAIALTAAACVAA
jgi:hypothetical protein